MNELTLDGKVYVSSKQAAEMTGYAKDYVGQLCREGRVEARLVGRNWYVLKAAIEQHRFGEKPANKPIIEDTKTDPWTPPRYHTEEAPAIPTLKYESINIDEPAEINNAPEANFEPQEATTAVQDQWQQWFSSTPAVEEESKEEVADDAVNIPIHTIHHHGLDAVSQPTETRYTTYASPEEYVEPKITERIVDRTPKSQGTPVLSALLVVVMLFAVITAYIGAGFAPREAINRWPMSLLAGTSAYSAE